MDDITELASNTKVLILDVDGVCTDGTLYFNDSGETIKAFNSQDGIGIKLIQNAGVIVAIITARKSKAIEKRFSKFKVKHIYEGFENKSLAYEELKKNLNVSDDEVAYVGDDLPDLPVMLKAKLGIAVENAHPYIKERANWITTKSGGKGAVREVCDIILKAKNCYDKTIQEYFEAL